MKITIELSIHFSNDGDDAIEVTTQEHADIQSILAAATQSIEDALHDNDPIEVELSRPWSHQQVIVIRRAPSDPIDAAF